MKKLLCLLIITLLFPSMAWAFGMDWESHQNDRSIYYLGLLFGQVGTVLPSAVGNEIIGELLRIFNIAVLTVGTMIVVYSTIVTTISTAQEGEVMGKKWSSIWIPIRSATGLAMLLPTASGFSLIQILMMWIILQGIHGANQIWTLVLDKAMQGQGLTSSMNFDKKTAVRTSMELFKSLVCMYRLNDSEAFQALVGGDQVDLYYPDSAPNEVWIGIEGNSEYEKVCGGVRASAFPSYARDENQWNRQQLAAGEIAFLSMNSYAEEAAKYPNDRSEWTGEGVIRNAAKGIKGTVTNIDLKVTSPNLIFVAAMEDGWIHAGNYYFKLIRATGAQNFVIPVPSWLKQSNFPADWGIITRDANAYLKVSDGMGDGGAVDPDKIELSSPPGLSKKAKAAMGSSVSGMTGMMRGFMSHLSNRDIDPIASFQRTGSEIMMATELIFLLLVLLLPLLMVVACIYSGIQPACYVLGTIVVILFPVLIIILSLLWSAGVAIGIYLPLVPFFVYTFTALGWIALVVETIVAAPIVALGITTPGQEALGRASPAVLLITNVFLRPSLIVIGFIASARLVNAVMGMINYGFEAFVLMNVGAMMLFGNIALIVIYAGVAITAIHQTFSLTHVLADKVIRWIGGQAEQSQVESMMQDAKKASETAAESTGAVMKGAGEQVIDKAKGAVEKGPGEGGGGGKDSGGGGISLGGGAPG